MPVTRNKLSPRAVETLSKPGRHSDGDGLYLVVDVSGARRWLFMFRWQGKLKEMGLGGFPTVPLVKARKKAQDAREVLDAGQNPIEERRAREKATDSTFGTVADALVDDLAPQWRNPKHIWQWRTTLTTFAAPLRQIPVDEVTTEDVLGVLRPIWTTKAETASRLRGRIERVLDAAKAKGLRSGENPARWRGHLDHLLPARRKLTRGHHAALPYADVAAFMAKLRERDGAAARALEFTILTSARTTEVREAIWAEIDRKAKVWTVPAERTKAGREHRVPLTDAALAVLDQLAVGEGFIFPGAQTVRSRRDGPQPLSTGSLERVLDRMKVGVTVHGFRSTFKDWATEATSFPDQVSEHALAHVVGDQSRRAYARSDMLEKRRQLMQAWASFCVRPAGGSVVTLRASR